MTGFDKTKAIRDLSKFIGCLILLVAIVAIGYFFLHPRLNPPDTPLQTAVKNHDLETVQRILLPPGDEKASVQAYSVYRLALESLSPSKARSGEILRSILQRNPQPNKFGWSSAPPERPADMIFITRPRNSRSSYRQSAVELATRQWSPEGVKALLDHGLTIRSEGVSDALVAAAGNGCDAILVLLLDAGGDVNGKDQHNDTPLAMARRQNNQRIVRLLLSRGAQE